MSEFLELPSGWSTAPISQICEPPQYGYTASAQSAPVGPRLLRITDIQNRKVNWSGVPFCKCEQVEKYQLQRGDILFARTGATTGKSFLVGEVPESAVFASYLIRLRVGQDVLPEYLYWYFQSPDYWSAVFGGIDDGNRPNMNGSKLAELVVPFPKETREQRRIVARIEALTRRLDKARQARQAALAEAATVFQRALENEFSEEAAENWREVPATRLFEIVSGQASPLDPQFKHLPYLGPEHVETGTGRIVGERLSVERLKMKSGKYLFTPEHVVYSKIRPALRKVCLPDYTGLCSADMYSLKPNADEVTREFLLLLLLAPPFSEYAVDKSDRNAMPKINREALFGFTFRVPKKPAQKRIAKLLLTLRAKSDELQRLQREVDAELAAFMPALLAKAFRGEL